MTASLQDLDTESLTNKQFWLAGLCAVKGHPRILKDASETRVARNLEKLGWGTVEDGAGSERIFRLNQDGEDAFSWVKFTRVAIRDVDQ